MKKIIIHNYADIPSNKIVRIMDDIDIDNLPRFGEVRQYIIGGKPLFVEVLPQSYGVRVNLLYKKVEG